MPTIPIDSEDLILQLKRTPLIDVRTPAEYAHAHIPGAYNLPVFSNEERVIIGTAYKQQSREKAVKIGLDFFGPKMTPIIEEAEALVQNDDHKNIMIHCWRGGMRSGAMGWLLSFYGFNVQILNGGYKAYRNYILNSFTQSYDLKVLGGYTGTGKTVVLHELKNKTAPIIDLEDLAKHRGSAFGSMPEPQPSQEMFENLLAQELIKNKENSYWIEDESQRIGNMKIPDPLWETMRSAPVYFIDIPFNERLNHIMHEYAGQEDEQIAGSITRISKRLGPQHAKAALEFLKAGDKENCFSILLKYYDRHYEKGLHNRNDSVHIYRKSFDKLDPQKISKSLLHEKV